MVPDKLSCFYINREGLSFGSTTASKEDLEVKTRFRQAVDVAEIYAVNPSNSREMAKAWIRLGNFAASVPVPWDDQPHTFYDYSINCYQRAMHCDPGLKAAWHNLAVLSLRMNIPEFLSETFRGTNNQIQAIIATAKQNPNLIDYEFPPKIPGYVYHRTSASFAPKAPAPKNHKSEPRNTPDQKKMTVAWNGSFLDHGSLSHVNRELTQALIDSREFQLQRVSNGAPASPAFKNLARDIADKPSPDTSVTVRHAWPPDWRRPVTGKLVVIQPWEFGALPAQWVEQARDVDEFWVPSEYVRRVYVESGVPADKIVVLPNGVNPEKFHPQVAPMKLSTVKKFKFLFVGGTIFRKGPDVLLKAYLEQFTAADDVCLVIKDFGGASVYAGQTFEAKIRAAQAQPNAPEILYLNEELPPDALPGLYTACDCLVLPYRGEGFGLPVLEAMACGLPVIVTAGGATDDFVRDTFAWRIPSQRKVFGNEISGLKLTSHGWLLEPNLAALGQALRAAFTSPSETRQRGQVAAEHAKQYFTWENAAAIAAKRLSELGRVELEKQPAKKAASPAKVKITLPPCALVGHLGTAREQFSQKRPSAAWASVLQAIVARPFHPEAFLLLAEIAQTVGDGPSAKLCAEHARAIAPGWKPAKKFLNQRLKGGARPEWLVLLDQIGNPKSEIRNRLSVCLIVKNEEKFLGQCLKSIRGLATQIVVVDTGSTDRTVEIAKEFGAEVYTFTWGDDFSSARNAALEHATGDWVLVLDADEELSATGAEALKTAMSHAAVMAWRLPIVDVGREADGCAYVPRLFRNAPGLFYVGRVHEQVFSSIEVRRGEWGLENRVGDASLIHHGYTAEMTRDRNKVERNLKLLERAVEELPDEPHLLMNLGLELGRSGRETEALERYRQAFDSLSSKPAAEIVPELRETLLGQFCTRLTAAKQVQEVVQVLTSPLANMSGGLTASLHFTLGLAHLELKQFGEAAEQMRHCLTKRTQRSHAPINKEINSAAPHHCLAMCLIQTGNAGGAETAFQEGLKASSNGEAIRLDYARFLAGQNRPVDALHRLNEVITQNPQHLVAWRLGGQIALSRPEFLEFARDWTGEAMRHVPQDPAVMAQRAETLMLSEDVPAALEIWERVWNLAPMPAVLAALIFCEALESPTTHAPQDDQEEIATSRAFIGWYRKMLAVSAQPTILRLNGQMDKLVRALPGAAKILEAAFAEASQANVAVAVG
jgi:glycosyltransferase involved in cell wall biosynthesis/predicted Zn-dependent protease